MLEQAGVPLKGLNIEKLRAEYQELAKQKAELSATYKNSEKEVKQLFQKLEKLNQYFKKSESTLEQFSRDKNPTL